MTSGAAQRGFVLVSALIFLVILTLLVVSAIRVGNSSLRIAGNMQQKEEAVAAAHQATEQVISVNFTADPIAQTINIDVNKDGTTDYVVTIPAQTCTSTKALLATDLNHALPADAPCLPSGTASNTGLLQDGSPLPTGQSWCNQQKWEVEAQVANAVTGAAVRTHTGVSLRTVVGTDCP